MQSTKTLWAAARWTMRREYLNLLLWSVDVSITQV